jgi:catechol 2,3-dioxygenase-like lactoylglutathione lyase family enzyme
MASSVGFAFALEYVSDIQAAKRFYVDILGLEVDREAPTFVQFRDKAGAHFAIASDESLGDRNEIELYWLVDNIEAVHSDLARKTEISLPLRDLPYGKVFGVTDAEGRTRYLLEFAQQRPSRPV